MTWFVYIAQAKTGRYYTGITEDPPQRILDHNEGRGAKFSKDQGALRLTYISPLFETKSEARKCEIQIGLCMTGQQCQDDISYNV
ncbi:hypothetical protein AUJ46_05525 [Candidatus Peregrinibacteria bacterium CG1_02_54_53]|nr:MAG: hypothetical protein AUJ46_05525 [Candidatus Peregrinibacteria bacterium CG1_02_54_53]